MTEAEKINPLIVKMNKSNAMPGMTFRLPSRGVPYENGEIDSDVQDGEILVHPMSTLDDIYLKTPDMLFQGTAIEQTVSRCCPQIKSPLDLLSKDVDYVLSAMRMVSYGNILAVPFKCNCEKAKEIDVEVPINNFVNRAKTITKEDLDRLTFDLFGFRIELQYVTFRNMLALGQQDMETDEVTPEEIFSKFIRNLAVNVKAIDGITDKEMILEFLRKQQRKFQMALLDHVRDANSWGLNFDHAFTCKWCGEQRSVTVSLNPVSFFTEHSSREQPNKSEI